MRTCAGLAIRMPTQRARAPVALLWVAEHAPAAVFHRCPCAALHFPVIRPMVKGDRGKLAVVALTCFRRSRLCQVTNYMKFALITFPHALFPLPTGSSPSPCYCQKLCFLLSPLSRASAGSDDPIVNAETAILT